MKHFISIFYLTCLLALTATAQVPQLITHQGYLSDSTGQGVTATLPMTFRFFANSSGGTALFTHSFSGVQITKGNYAVILDASLLSFASPYWLETEANAEVLSPRTRLTSVPYALKAMSILGPSSEATGTNAIAGGTNNRARGNYSVVAGGGGINESDSNSAIGSYSTISGGRHNFANASSSTVSGGYINAAWGDYSTVGGGVNNNASANSSTVGGGYRNIASNVYSTIGGGANNFTRGDFAVVGGGYENLADDSSSTVSGGKRDTASGPYSTVPGGKNNKALGWYSLAAGARAKALHSNTFVWGDDENLDFASTANNQFLIRASGGVGINTNSPGATLGIAGTIKIVDGTEGAGKVLTSDVNGLASWQIASGGSGAYLPLAGGTMTGAITSTGDPEITMGKGNFGSNNINTGTMAFVSGSKNRARGDFSVVSGGGGFYASDSNSATGNCSTISGGRANATSGYASTVGGGYGNTASGNTSTIGGGVGNHASDYYSTVGGGFNNTASEYYCTVGGGYGNYASADNSTVGGGYGNYSAGNSTVSGGKLDTASGWFSTVPGGENNKASGWYSFAAGARAKALHSNTFVWGDDELADFASSASNQFLVRASGGVGINTNSPGATLGIAGNIKIVDGTQGTGKVLTSDANGLASWQNVSGSGDYLPLAGGTLTGAILNTGDPEITMGKGNFGTGNINTGTQAFVAGSNNRARGEYSVVSGGGGPAPADSNSALGNYNVVGGGVLNKSSSNYATVSGGAGNKATGQYATVSGGGLNQATENSATVGGGRSNTASNAYSTTGGGNGNTASEYCGTVAGGESNMATGMNATIGGGKENSASNMYTTVGGGTLNKARGEFSVVSGGGGLVETDSNSALGAYSTIPGGTANKAAGDYSFAAGRRAKANHNGTFVWGDALNADFSSTAANQFLIRASGGVGIGTNSTSNILTIQQSSATDPVADAWTTYSSRRWKKDIQTLEHSLEKVGKLRGVSYKEKETDKACIGLIAEEVGEVIPEVVEYEENGVDAKSVDYARIVALLIEGMKEQQKKIHEQQNAMEQQQMEINKLKELFSVQR